MTDRGINEPFAIVWPPPGPPDVMATAPERPPRRPMRFTASQVAAITGGAVATGRIRPGQGRQVRDRLMAGGPDAGQQLTELAAAWTDDETYAALYPAQPAPRPPREPDRLAQADVRQAWLRQQSASVAAVALPPDQPPEVIDHGPFTGEHEHAHSDYSGRRHSHRHGHQGDGSHAPGTSHVHQAAGNPLAAGIAARRRERTRPATRSRRPPMTAYTRRCTAETWGPRVKATGSPGRWVDVAGAARSQGRRDGLTFPRR